MEIRTKFNVGDKIFVVYLNSSKYYCVTSIKVYEITIRSNNYIIYSADETLSYSRYDLNGYDEKDCFATKKEAQKECNRRNKGEQK